jgi:hypothetical protein
MNLVWILPPATPDAIKRCRKYALTKMKSKN